MKTKKLLSILLALMMMLSVVPFYASAAEPIALTEANVTVWPTASGEIWFGQKISDGITLSGGEVQYDGAVVAGHFEFVDVDFMPTSGGQTPANIKFIPEDTQAYSGFELEYAWDVLYTVKYVMPELVDKNNPPIATEVEAGARISTSTISGGAVKNPITNEIIEDAVWKWSSSRTKVNESGYYPAKLSTSSSGYDVLTMDIYVRIAGDTPETSIEVNPTVDITYDPNLKWEDVEFKNGKAVIKGSSVEVVGSFEVTEKWKTVTPLVSHTEVDVKFTPSDATQSLPIEFKVPVTVNPAKIAFVSENGAEIVPEITIPYGLKMGDDISGYLKPYLNGTASFNYEETEYYNEYIPVGTHELTVKTICDDPNYERCNTLTFKLTVEPVETAVTVKYDINKDNKNTYEIYVVKADVDGARPQGNFAIYVDGKLLKDGAKYSEHITWSPEKSKAYTVKVVYTPTANDPCLVADTEITVDAKLYRNITTVNTISDGTKQFRCGEKIQVAANVPEFSGWVITDAAGNTVDLGVDLSAKSIELAVPDFDVKLEAKGKTSSGSDGLGNIFDMDFGDLSEGDSEWAIINIIRNLIAKFKSFLQQLIETFQSIGG